MNRRPRKSVHIRPQYRVFPPHRFPRWFNEQSKLEVGALAVGFVAIGAVAIILAVRVDILVAVIFGLHDVF